MPHLVFAILLPLLGCHPLIEPGDDSVGLSPRTPPAPPALTALSGEGVVLLWLDRELDPDERLERLDDSGSWQRLATSGRVCVDPQPSGAYRWSDSGRVVLARPTVGELTFTTPELPLVHAPGSKVQRTLHWDGPSLDELELAIAITREHDGAWLVEGDDLDAWEDGESLWKSFEPGDAPTRLSAEWSADAEFPMLARVEASLLVHCEGRSWILARAETQVLELGRQLAWGDTHNHTNLSFDGCEDTENFCATQNEAPGAELFWEAEQAGLEFLALTDHAEWETYINLEHDYTLNIWEKTLELAARAEGGPVLPVVAFEWTGAYENKDGENIGGHRIVYFEDLDPCEEFWKSAGEREQAKSAWGLESYTLRSRAAGKPQVLVEALEATAEICGATRWLSWFHHTAYSPPRPVAWSEDVNRMLNDSVVEILSEHGSSECYDTTLEGCRWNVNMDRWAGKGSVQEALQVGLHLGFVGGTDNHEARPGSVEDGAGPIASYYDENGDGYEDPYHFMTAPGSITGVLYAGAELDRPALFDGIEARNTVAATWLFDEVRVVAVGQDGEVYLPGSEVPAIASPLRLVVEIGEEVMDTWQILLLDPWNNVHAMAEERRLDTDIDLAPGDARYLRVDAWSDKVQHRLWVSPFFGVE